MNITIVCIGKLKEKYWREAVAEYSKRLGGYCSLTVKELKEAPLPSNPSPADEEAVKKAEGEAILGAVKDQSYVISLEVKGRKFSSEELAERMADLALTGRSDVTFIIGGSLGLSAEVSKRADLRLSFSDMTFPHQMMRVILLEQIYRSFKINRNETYHK
ncbi:MAG: 23S rRNA (pseudouridine(1915)-N(3))-methyltransferase RlmH [Firmicutes bacterium]|nr:23S rRNA (pseudouridine(1915)-N(3))-methyltransferase RlmH [Bacillota bacterium]